METTLPTVPFSLLCDLARDPGHGWSIGTFGAIGEFVRDLDEPASVTLLGDRIEVVTARGGLRIVDGAALHGVAWDSLSADGETWGHSLSLCLPRGDHAATGILPLGRDTEALRREDRDFWLFDLGVGAGQVHMCARTADSSLANALHEAAGQPVTAVPSLMPIILQAQPQRVLLSPAGRIEVYQPIPSPDGRSPDGPHTHLLPKLIAKGLTHAATTPLPEPLHAVLTVHPPSPWRRRDGTLQSFDARVDAEFEPHLRCFGLSEDAVIDRRVRAAVGDGTAPEAFAWPESRRGRAKARIVLRRLAAAGEARAAAWRLHHDAPGLRGDESTAVLD